MRKLYEITVVDKKTDEIRLDEKVAATSEIDAVLKAAVPSMDTKKVDVVIRDLAELSKELDVVRVETE